MVDALTSVGDWPLSIDRPATFSAPLTIEALVKGSAANHRPPIAGL